VECHAVQPALWISQSFDGIVPVEAFIVGGIAVQGKPGTNKFPLDVVQKLGGIGIVVNEPVRKDSHHDGCEA